MNQEPLDLNSPLFAPRPGWGGKIKKWLKSHFGMILPYLAFAVLGLGLYLLLS